MVRRGRIDRRQELEPALVRGPTDRRGVSRQAEHGNGRPVFRRLNRLWHGRRHWARFVPIHSSEKAIDDTIGNRASQALKSIGGAKQIEKANDIERRELEKRFNQDSIRSEGQ